MDPVPQGAPSLQELRSFHSRGAQQPGATCQGCGAGPQGSFCAEMLLEPLLVAGWRHYRRAQLYWDFQLLDSDGDGRLPARDAELLLREVPGTRASGQAWHSFLQEHRHGLAWRDIEAWIAAAPQPQPEPAWAPGHGHQVESETGGPGRTGAGTDSCSLLWPGAMCRPWHLQDGIWASEPGQVALWQEVLAGPRLVMGRRAVPSRAGREEDLWGGAAQAAASILTGPGPGPAAARPSSRWAQGVSHGGPPWHSAGKGVAARGGARASCEQPQEMPCSEPGALPTWELPQRETGALQPYERSRPEASGPPQMGQRLLPAQNELQTLQPQRAPQTVPGKLETRQPRGSPPTALRGLQREPEALEHPGQRVPGARQLQGAPQAELAAHEPQDPQALEAQDQGESRAQEPQRHPHGEQEPQGHPQGAQEPQGCLHREQKPQGHPHGEQEPQGHPHGVQEPQGHPHREQGFQGCLHGEQKPQGHPHGEQEPQGHPQGAQEPQGCLHREQKPQGHLHGEQGLQGHSHGVQEPQGHPHREQGFQGCLHGEQGPLQAQGTPQGDPDPLEPPEHREPLVLQPGQLVGLDPPEPPQRQLETRQAPGRLQWEPGAPESPGVPWPQEVLLREPQGQQLPRAHWIRGAPQSELSTPQGLEPEGWREVQASQLQPEPKAAAPQEVRGPPEPLQPQGSLQRAQVRPQEGREPAGPAHQGPRVAEPLLPWDTPQSEPEPWGAWRAQPMEPSGACQPQGAVPRDPPGVHPQGPRVLRPALLLGPGSVQALGTLHREELPAPRLQPMLPGEATRLELGPFQAQGRLQGDPEVIRPRELGRPQVPQLQETPLGPRQPRDSVELQEPKGQGAPQVSPFKGWGPGACQPQGARLREALGPRELGGPQVGPEVAQPWGAPLLEVEPAQCQVLEPQEPETEEPQVSPQPEPATEGPWVSPQRELETEEPQASPQPEPEEPRVSPQREPETEGPRVSPQRELETEEPRVSPQPEPETEEPQVSPQPEPEPEEPPVSPQRELETEEPRVSPQREPETEGPRVSSQQEPETGGPRESPQRELETEELRVSPQWELETEEPRVSPQWDLETEGPRVSPQRETVTEEPRVSPQREPETEGPRVSPQREPETEGPRVSSQREPETEGPRVSPQREPETEGPRVSPQREPETEGPRVSSQREPETEGPRVSPQREPETEEPLERRELATQGARGPVTLQDTPWRDPAPLLPCRVLPREPGAAEPLDEQEAVETQGPAPMALEPWQDQGTLQREPVACGPRELQAQRARHGNQGVFQPQEPVQWGGEVLPAHQRLEPAEATGPSPPSPARDQAALGGGSCGASPGWAAQHGEPGGEAMGPCWPGLPAPWGRLRGSPLRREKAFIRPSRREQQEAVRRLAELQLDGGRKHQRDKERQLLRFQERLSIARHRSVETLPGRPQPPAAPQLQEARAQQREALKQHLEQVKRERTHGLQARRHRNTLSFQELLEPLVVPGEDGSDLSQAGQT